MSGPMRPDLWSLFWSWLLKKKPEIKKPTRVVFPRMESKPMISLTEAAKDRKRDIPNE